MGRKQCDFGGKNSSDTVSKEYNVRICGFMGTKPWNISVTAATHPSKLSPIAEIIPGKLNLLFGLVSWVNLGMYNMRVCKSDGDEVMHMGWETLKACFSA